MLLVLLASVLGGAAAWWLNQPLPMATDSVDVSIDPRTSAQGVAQVVVRAGVDTSWQLLYAWFRLSGDARQIRAGSYEIERGTTPRGLLRKLVLGEESLRAMTLVEGWTFRQLREALATAPQLRHETAGLTDQAIMERLGRSGQHPEGRFFPDTYSYAKGSSDLKLLALAMRTMDRHLQAAWQHRSADSPLQTPEQALILASIVEKETGREADRPQIAAVFSNRLRVGMMLQTDPTVIYGLGERFDGNLRKKDLQTDTPWNTYTRTGLPPTPIAMPGRNALLAAVAPAPTKALYFVARGDGSSEFSASLDEHNRAVNKFQRRQ
ncbi:MAG: endolytic transglycosylase MltG [Rhodoferax sp.]|nr:endolytic transglycosylase MltG [Rhodoferax sp.]MBP9931895.1 endolytic transglycosylase MltG [Rhodoferax sp.]HQX61668.1 endolytic transglycosylase MltG [Burkholderiaceae bacterium]HQZ04726.1 endolytic transglycosylase MltG [Burkholderiaceae bacterium]